MSHTGIASVRRLTRLRLMTLAGVTALVLLYGAVWIFAPWQEHVLDLFWPFSLVGLAGALVANSTGVGGGVVFVPAFSMLRESGAVLITPAQTVGTSFAIQCFGMTMGSLTWINRFYRPDADPREAAHRPALWRIILLALSTGLPVLLITQYALAIPADTAFVAFKVFSISLGSLLLVQIIATRGGGTPREELRRHDERAILAIGVLGGVATALFSVGIGEILALYLFLRRFPLDISVASAVVVSAISVWAGAGYHLMQGNLIWEILIFAAPAVALGGFLARRLAHWLGAFRLKLGTALWIISSSAALLFIL